MSFKITACSSNFTMLNVLAINKEFANTVEFIQSYRKLRELNVIL